MDKVDVIDFLKKIELFRGLTDDEYEKLTSCIKERVYKPNELLFRENGARESIFIVYKGAVELFKSNSFGVELKLTYFSKGDFLGEGAWASDSPHSTSARALIDTTVFGNFLMDYDYLISSVSPLRSNPSVNRRV